MGFIDTSSLMPILYNVVHAVGVNCPNQKDDVMMVQYLLLHFYNNVTPKEATPRGEMTVDGICGPITKNWIKKFQLDLMFTNNSVAADGRIDRIRNTQTLRGSISGTIYTLVSLDWNVAHIAPFQYATLPTFVPIANPNNVPPPSPDVVKPKSPPPIVPATGGF